MAISKSEIRNPNGSVLLGSGNAGWCHIYTDRPAFIFNKPVFSYTNQFSSYSDGDLQLQTGISGTNTGTTRMTIQNSTGNVGIGTTSPRGTLEVNGNLYIAKDKWLTLGGESGSSGKLAFAWSETFKNNYIDFGGNIYFRCSASNSPLVIEQSGNLGIGFQTSFLSGTTHTQGYKLAVNGGGSKGDCRCSRCRLCV